MMQLLIRAIREIRGFVPDEDLSMLGRLAALLGLGERPLTAESLEQVKERATAALRGGDRLKAEQIVHAAAEQAAVQDGRQSHLYAQALSNETTILRSIGELARAAAACRTAAEMPAANRAGQKDRLTYWMNLAEILTLLEKLDEAEAVLRQGLIEREAFYGADHPGYAFGLAPLAENLLGQGRASEAEPLIEQAVEINWEAGHEAVASDLAIRAFVITTAHGPEASALDHWPQLPPSVQELLVSECLSRAERAEPHAAQAVLLELRRRLQATPDVDAQQLASVNAQLANVARLTGDDELRIESSRMATRLGGGRDDSQHRTGFAAEQ